MNFKALNGLRFLATLGIFVHHHWLLLWVPESRDLAKNFYSKYMYEGFSGVTFFFILSGFLMTLNYEKQLAGLDKNLLVTFYRRRIIKIYPSYLITLMLSLKGNHITWLLIMNIFLIQSYIPKPEIFFSYNGPSWFLSSILFSYIVFPFAVLYLRKNNNLMRSIVSLFVVFFIQVLIVVIISPVVNAHFWFYIFPPFRFMDFMLGINLAMVYSLMQNKQISKKYCKWGEFLCIAAMVILVINSSNININYRFNIYYSLAFIIMLIIFSYEQGMISRILSLEIFQYMGTLSFYIYLLHAIIITHVTGLAAKYGMNLINYYIIPRMIFDFILVVLLSIVLKKVDGYIVKCLNRVFA